MFSSGADGKTPELRASSLKGAMRFWWRAFNSHFPIESTVTANGDKSLGLRELESLIFGGAGFESSDGQRSTFSLQILGNRIFTDNTPWNPDYKLVPHKDDKFKARSFHPTSEFEIIVRIPKDYKVYTDLLGIKTEVFNREKLIALLQLTSILGGMGKRVRRGMGSWQIDSASVNQTSLLLASTSNIQDIFNLVKILSPHYILQNDGIIAIKFSGKKDKYPWVSKIEIGKKYPNADRLLSDISSATHTIKERVTKEKGTAESYNVSLGHATSGRFASPVYVSVLPDFSSIVTTLNTIPGQNSHLINSKLQEQFKNSFL